CIVLSPLGGNLALQFRQNAKCNFAIRPIWGKRKPPCKHITSYFAAFQVISVIRPPCLPGKKADRRIW
ncbi:hypothetical protein, partial [Bacteroides acidifaciens]|uniref:hypothetical protein n=1 Tax=Bacteroides acidifaciens TaxID=85831 RepID=UPI002574BFBC